MGKAMSLLLTAVFLPLSESTSSSLIAMVELEWADKRAVKRNTMFETELACGRHKPRGWALCCKDTAQKKGVTFFWVFTGKYKEAGNTDCSKYGPAGTWEPATGDECQEMTAPTNRDGATMNVPMTAMSWWQGKDHKAWRSKKDWENENGAQNLFDVIND